MVGTHIKNQTTYQNKYFYNFLEKRQVSILLNCEKIARVYLDLQKYNFFHGFLFSFLSFATCFILSR